MAGAGTVHLGDSLAEISVAAAQIAGGVVTDHPFLLLAQMTTTDPTRSPADTESAWDYAHGPAGVVRDDEAVAAFVCRMEERIDHCPRATRNRRTPPVPRFGVRASRPRRARPVRSECNARRTSPRSADSAPLTTVDTHGGDPDRDGGGQRLAA